MFLGNDKHPDAQRHLDDGRAFSPFTWKTEILQTQRGYKLEDNKQIFDSVRRIPSIWVQN